jgi:hypothetical protein
MGDGDAIDTFGSELTQADGVILFDGNCAFCRNVVGRLLRACVGRGSSRLLGTLGPWGSRRTSDRRGAALYICSFNPQQGSCRGGRLYSDSLARIPLGLAGEDNRDRAAGFVRRLLPMGGNPSSAAFVAPGREIARGHPSGQVCRGRLVIVAHPSLAAAMRSRAGAATEALHRLR